MRVLITGAARAIGAATATAFHEAGWEVVATAVPLEGAYAASKFGLEAVSEAMHYELRHFGIRTVIVEPGYTAPGMKASPRWGLEPPYDELAEQWYGADATLLGDAGRPGPELVAAAILESATADDPPLRCPVGPDAQMILATRAQVDDAAFEAAMRDVLGLTW